MHEDSISDKQLEQILDVLQLIASGDLTARTPITDNQSMFNAICTGINMLAEEVEARIGIQDEHENALLNILEDLNEEKSRAEAAKEALNLSATQWKATFNAISDSVCLINNNGKILQCNETMAKLLGKPNEEIVGETCWELIHETSKSIDQCPMSRMRRTLKRESVEYPFGDRIINVSVDPILDKKGNLKGAVHIISDITDRKRAEQALQESEKRFKSMIEGGGDIITIMDVDGNIQYESPSLERVLGYTPEEFAGKNVMDLLKPEDLETIGGILPKILDAPNTPIPFQAHFKHKDGTWRIMEASINNLLNEPAINGFVVNSRDITDREKAEKALKDSEEKYRSLVSNIPDVIWRTDSEGNTTFISPNVQDVYGFTPEEIYENGEESWLDRIHHDDIESVKKTFGELFETGIPIDVEYRIKRKDGNWIWLRDRSTDVHEIDGIQFADGVFYEITKQKAAEEELQKLASVVKHSGELVNLASLDGKMVFLNEAGSEMLGIESENVENHQIMEVIPEHHLEMVKNELLPELMEKGHWEGDLQYQNIITDELTDVHTLCFTIKDPDSNQPKYLANVSLDITDRKKAEEKIQQQNEFLNTVLESLTHPFHVINVDDFSIKMTNSASGIDTLSEKSLTCYELTHRRNKPCDTKEHTCPLQEILRTKEPVVVEHTHFDRNGDLRLFEVHGFPIFDENRNVVQMIEYSLDITERKKAEEIFKVLFNSSRDAIMTLNPPSWKFTSGNPATVELFNAKDEAEFISKGPWDVSPEFQPDGQKSADKAKKMIQKAMEEGSNFFEWTHKRLDGDDFSATVLLTRVEIEEGKPFLQATVRDITEQKEYEVQLKEGKDRIELLFNNANDAILIHEQMPDGEPGNFVEVNDIACKIFGYSKEEFFEMTPKDLDPDQNYNSEKTRRNIYRNGKALFEGYAKRSDGTEIAIEVNTKTFHYKGKNLALAIARDITERKIADAALERTTKEINERAKELMCFYNVSKIMANTNKSLDEVLQKIVEIIQSSWQYPEITCARIIFQGKEYKTLNYQATDWSITSEIGLFNDLLGKIEVCYLKEIPNEFEGPFKKEERHLIDGLAREIGLFVSRKHAEEAKSKLFDELENKNLELKNFAYIVSHDLKAPLRAISSLANWIYTDNFDKMDKDSKEQLELLLNRVKRMNGLIDGILQYSRIGRLTEDKKDIDLNELIPEIIEGIRPPENIDITIRNELPTITFEPTRIEQVFQNLIGNAAKYMDKDNGMITVEASEESEFWKFSVSDNGPGIDEKYHDKIFQIFQTLRPRDEVESTGIGLTIVKKIIDMYGGKIWLESKLGKGSTFHFTVPNDLKDLNGGLEI